MPDTDTPTNSSQVSEVLVWDIEGVPPADTGSTILWRAFATEALLECISIPQLIEENSDALRARYLAWIYELGEIVIDGKRLVDHLELRPGFSYWWMTLIAEKCNFAKSPLITDAIRFFAFDDWVRQAPDITSVTLVSANTPLHESFKCWCELKKIKFESQFIITTSEHKSLLRLTFDRLPDLIQGGIALLKYLIERWPLRGVGLDKWRQASGRTTFISYFFNLLPQAAQAGQFESQYWASLPQALDETGVNSSWLHIFVKNPVVPDAKSAAKLIQRFNGSRESRQAHVVLDSFLSTMAVVSSVRDFGKLCRLGRIKLVTVLQSRSLTDPRAESALWPLLKEDWNRSFFGVGAMRNLLMLNLFERALASLPKQCNGVYLQENQGWEFAMIHAWRVAGHGKLIGFPHSTVRFWDLRYFSDQRSYRKNKLAIPMPNLIAVSGESVLNAYLECGYPAEDLVEVEATRYLHLDKVDNKQLFSTPVSGDLSKLLILGDYLPSNTSLQMHLLREIADDLSSIELTVKPHPACPIVVADYPELKFELTEQSLSDLLGDFDIVYTSNVTSAAVDAYSAGLTVVSVLDPNTLNLSPLRGIAGVRFVSSAEMLSDALLEAYSQSGDVYERVDYFNVDSSLPRWQALLTE